MAIWPRYTLTLEFTFPLFWALCLPFTLPISSIYQHSSLCSHAQGGWLKTCGPYTSKQHRTTVKWTSSCLQRVFLPLHSACYNFLSNHLRGCFFAFCGPFSVAPVHTMSPNGTWASHHPLNRLISWKMPVLLTVELFSIISWAIIIFLQISYMRDFFLILLDQNSEAVSDFRWVIFSIFFIYYYFCKLFYWPLWGLLSLTDG